MAAHPQPPLRRLLGPLGAMLVIGLLAGYLIGRDVVASQSPAHVTPAATTASRKPVPTTPAARTTSSDGAGRPQAAAVTVTDPGRFAFLLDQPDGSGPIRWDPCRPIRYKVSVGTLVPASEIANVRAAFAVLGAALGGVTFAYDGVTDVVPDSIDDARRAGTDIVIAFATPGPGPTGSDLLTGWEAGRGGMAAAGAPGPDGAVSQRPTHGSVVLDAEKWDVMSRHDRTILYLHEFGHAVGLDHPRDGRQIMSSGAYDLPTRYQPGDLAGLARLGRQAGCVR